MWVPETERGSLKERQLFLTPEPSLQPLLVSTSVEPPCLLFLSDTHTEATYILFMLTEE